MSRFTTRTTELSFVLRPSRIQGVGVFTTHAIASGTHLAMFSRSVVRWLFVIVGALLGVVIVMSLIRGVSLLEMVPLMLVLLMSAVPVALPVMFTVSMAVGSKELAKRGVLV